MTKRKCSIKVPGMYSDINFYPCQRSATIQRDGKWYCWQHDPERVKAEAKKRHADWEAKMDREAAKYKRIARNAQLAALVTEEMAELLERLAYAIGNVGTNEDAKDAFELAARIREALEDDDETR